MSAPASPAPTREPTPTLAAHIIRQAGDAAATSTRENLQRVEPEPQDAFRTGAAARKDLQQQAQRRFAADEEQMRATEAHNRLLQAHVDELTAQVQHLLDLNQVPPAAETLGVPAPTGAPDSTRLPRLEWDRTKLAPRHFLAHCETTWLDFPRVPEPTRVRHAVRAITLAGEAWVADFSDAHPTTTWATFVAAFNAHYGRPQTLNVEYHALHAVQLRLRGGEAYETQLDQYLQRLHASSQSAEIQRVLLDHWVEPHLAWTTALVALRLIPQPFYEYCIQVRAVCPPPPAANFRRHFDRPKRRRAAKSFSAPASSTNGPRDGRGGTNPVRGRDGNSRPWQRDAQANFAENLVLEQSVTDESEYCVREQGEVLHHRCICMKFRMREIGSSGLEHLTQMQRIAYMTSIS